VSNSPTDGEELWRLRKARKCYLNRTAVDIEALDLLDGERVAFVGSNGSGKSTLLRLLAGISIVSSGELIPMLGVKSMRKAFVPQTGGVYPGSTVRDNLQIRANLYGVNLRNVRKNYIERFGLDGFLDVLVGRLSGGYQRLCAVACACCVEPECLFIDEPYSGLDEQQSGNLNIAMEELGPTLRFLAITEHRPENVPKGFKVWPLRDGAIVK
jgi:ABC-type multidrug transport system ATPase subunit